MNREEGCINGRGDVEVVGGEEDVIWECGLGGDEGGRGDVELGGYICC